MRFKRKSNAGTIIAASACAVAAASVVGLGVSPNLASPPSPAQTMPVNASSGNLVGRFWKPLHVDLMNGTNEPIWIQASIDGSHYETTQILRTGENIVTETPQVAGSSEVRYRIFRVSGDLDRAPVKGDLVSVVYTDNENPKFGLYASADPRTGAPCSAHVYLDPSEGHEAWTLCKMKYSVKRDADSSTTNMKMSLHELDHTPMKPKAKG